MILAAQTFLSFAQRVMSKVRSITIENLLTSLDGLDGSDNQPLVKKAVDHSWVTGVVHHRGRGVNGSSNSELTGIYDRTFIIVQVGITGAHLVDGVAVTDQLGDVPEQKTTNVLELIVGFVIIQFEVL